MLVFAYEIGSLIHKFLADLPLWLYFYIVDIWVYDIETYYILTAKPMRKRIELKYSHTDWKNRIEWATDNISEIQLDAYNQ